MKAELQESRHVRYLQAIILEINTNPNEATALANVYELARKALYTGPYADEKQKEESP